MNELTFKGRISKGYGKHKELGVPGRGVLTDAPKDWPDLLFRGSLNITIDADGYPEEFNKLSIPLTTKSLDLGLFPAVFEIKQHEFELNLLEPTSDMKNRGDAQVWRAKIFIKGSEENVWILRGYGSGLSNVIELVSAIRIRDKYKLSENRMWDCTVKLYYDQFKCP